MIATILTQALMYEIYMIKYNDKIKVQRITWLGGKSIDSPLGGTRFKTLRAPLYMHTSATRP